MLQPSSLLFRHLRGSELRLGLGFHLCFQKALQSILEYIIVYYGILSYIIDIIEPL